jgi:hypothetical protein
MKNNMTKSIAVIACQLVLLLSLGACSPKPTAPSSYEVSGTPAERVAEVSKIVAKHSPLPSPLLDAHFTEEKIGDDRLGPADFKTFYALTVAPADLPAWKAALSQAKPWNRFSNDDEIRRVVPTKAQPWWVNAADLGKLEFFSPHLLTGNANGWAAIAPDGRIFVYVFTM